jgi:hypothetical protein
MTELKDVLAYLLKKYPHKQHLSDARVTKMVYLADWRHSLTQGDQVTDIKWMYNHYGPYVKKVSKAVRNGDIFELDETKNYYGDRKKSFQIKEPDYEPSIGTSEKAAIDHIIEETKDLNWDDFVKLVYSTYPIVDSEKYEDLDLPSLAIEYKDSGIREKVSAGEV